MTIYLSDKTGARIDQLLDFVDESNIGVGPVGVVRFAGDVNTLTTVGFRNVDASASTNAPDSFTDGAILTQRWDGSSLGAQFYSAITSARAFIRGGNFTTAQWEELYHTGNTSVLEFSTNPSTATGETISIGNAGNDAILGIIRDSTSANQTMVQFVNSNGVVGSILTNGTATSYSTSSDPRLKDFKELPSDELINSEFDNLFDCFRVFNWNNDLDGDLVWGFDAHECIDKDTSIGSEGEGPRNLSLGEVYNTTPAVYEDQEQPVLYKSGDKIGQPRLDSDGEPFMETVSVEVEAAIEHKVTPAGVDQSKAVPILLAKIEQLERRLTAAGL